MKNYAQKITKGSFAIFISLLLAAILGYVLRLYLSRVLTVEEFGLFFAIFVLFSFLGLFRDFGLSQTIVKFIPEFLVKKDKKSIKSAFWFTVVFQVCITAIIVAFLFVFRQEIALTYFHSAQAALPLMILAVLFFVNILFGTIQHFLQGMHRMDYYSLMQPVNLVLTFITVAVLAYLGIVGVAAGYTIAATITVVLGFVLILKAFPDFFRTKFTLRWKANKKLFSFSKWLFIGFIGGYLLSYIDTIILTAFRTLEEVAWYQVALPTAQILWIVPMAITTVIFPVVSELMAVGKNEVAAMALAASMKFSFILVLPFAMFGVAFSEFIITTFFGAAYVQAALAFQILCVGALFYTLWTICNTSLIAIGQPRVNTMIIIGVSVFTVVANLMVVNVFGIYGIAFVLLLSFLLAFVVSFYTLRKYIDIKFPLIDIAKSILLGLAMMGIVFVLKAVLVLDPLVEAVLCVIVGMAFYLFFVLVTGIVTRQEVKNISDAGMPVPRFVVKILSKLAR